LAETDPFAPAAYLAEDGAGEALPEVWRRAKAMKTMIRQLALGAVLSLGIAGLGAGLLGAGLVAGAQAMGANGPVVEQRSSCRTYDQAEFFLLTGIDSEYGGTYCTSH
jgi:hypothetical protein